MPKIASKLLDSRGGVWLSCRSRLCWHVELGLAAFRTMKLSISVVEAAQFIVLCVGCPSKRRATQITHNNVLSSQRSPVWGSYLSYPHFAGEKETDGRRLSILRRCTQALSGQLGTLPPGDQIPSTGIPSPLTSQASWGLLPSAQSLTHSQ